MTALSPAGAGTPTLVELAFGHPEHRRSFERNVPYRAFEDSWFALIQGIRHRPRLFDGRIYFCDHPHDPGRISVFHHLCDSPAELRDALHELLDLTSMRAAVWKTADPAHADAYAQAGFRPYHSNEGWGGGTRYDDQTYPQHVCALAPIADLRGAAFAQLRQQTAAIERAHGKLAIERYAPRQHEADCRRLAAFAAAAICAGDPEQSPYVFGANVLFLDHPPDVAYVVSHEGRPISFIGFDVRDGTANFNCLLYDRAFKYIATFTLVKMAGILMEGGATRWNLSGSEYGPLDAWKRKFGPEHSIRRTHLVLEREGAMP